MSPAPERRTVDPLGPLLALPEVAGGVADARAAVDRLLADRALRRRSADVSAESSLRGAWAAAALAGSAAELSEVRSGAATRDPLVQGALRAYAALPGLVDTWPRAPRQVLARLHVLAAADLVTDPDELGRPAPGTAPRLDTLASMLAMTEAPAVLVAALVHGEIAALDAFAPVSPVVALAAARLTLIDRGLDPKSLDVLEVGHRESGEAYRAALAAYRSGGPAGLGAWIAHCSQAVVRGAQEAAAIAQAFARG